MAELPGDDHPSKAIGHDVLLCSRSRNMLSAPERMDSDPAGDSRSKASAIADGSLSRPGRSM
jgi:hypothetical protein